MENREKFKRIFSNVSISKETEENIFNKTIYRKENKYNYKQIILKFISIIIVVFSLIGIGVVAKEYIQSFIIDKYIDEYGNGKVDLSIKGKVTIQENHNLMCHDNLTLREVELNLGIKFLDYKPFNNNKINQCEVLTDENGNIRRIEIVNEDNSGEYTIQNNNFKNLKGKKYLQLGIMFMTNYATKDDEEYFEKELNIITGSSLDGIEKMLEVRYIENIGMEVNIVKWADHRDFIQNMTFFVYDNVFYNFKATNITVDELVEILENL